MDSSPRLIVTAWRHSHELLQLRHDLYSSETLTREKAVNKVFAWRLRKPDGLPLLLESTADIVDVVLQDGRGQLQHNALRLLYATALSRFVTGLADTQIDLTRDRPSWFPSGKSLQLPLSLLETRHRIVHRHLPSLAELKRAATESLEWLWEWYWRQLDYAFHTGGNDGNDDELGVESKAAVKEKLQGLLKSYVKERKNEIKRRRDHSKAAETALSTYKLHFSVNMTRVLLELLVDDKMILPTDRKPGSSMSGAFLIWTPLLVAFCTSDGSCTLAITSLVNCLLKQLSVSRVSGSSEVDDPIKEALYIWTLHMLTSDEWASARQVSLAKMHQDVLTQIFSSPSFWGFRLAQALLDQGSVTNPDSWYAILAAARDDGDGSVEVQAQDAMDMDMEGVHEAALPVRNVAATTMTTTSEEKLQGPVKVLGMWKPRPIGWLAEGWSDDE